MPIRVANESEHRRGLVLGLTLAEVLILLLFLILLALGARLMTAEKALAELDSGLSELRKAGGLEAADARKIVADLGRMREMERSVQEFKDENARMRSELTEKGKQTSALEKFVKAARAVDPNEPPALLKLAVEMFEEVGVKVDRKQWGHLSEVTSALVKAEKPMTAAERDRFRDAIVAYVQSGGGVVPGHTWPPIIRLSEADGQFFAVGSAELTNEFEGRIVNKVIPDVLSIARDFQVNVIEVVGHTDEQTIAPRTSNLDKELIPVLRGDREVKTLIPADNAGLGLTRAVAIVEVLRRDKRLADFRILPLSAAQLVQLNEMVSTGAEKTNVKERRRIEIRMRKPNSSP
jgi:flagellar motor protein MotB